MNVSKILTNMATRAGNIAKMPMKKVGLPVLIAGTLLGGGGVALAKPNDKDMFVAQKTELPQQKAESPRTKIIREFGAYITNPNSLIALNKDAMAPIEPFNMLKYEDEGVDVFSFSMAYSEALKGEAKTDKLDINALAGELLAIFTEGAKSDVSRAKVVNLIQNEWKLLDVNKDGKLDETEMYARCLFLDRLDGKDDGKIDYKYFLTVKYTDPKTIAAVKDAQAAAQEHTDFIDFLMSL